MASFAPAHAQRSNSWARGAEPRWGAKLVMGKPGDAFEQEADRVADQVMRGGAPPASTGTAPLGVQRACAMCAGQQREDEDAHAVQRKAAPGAAPAGAMVSAPRVSETVGRPGQPLDAATQGFMESRFGQRFEGVRVHHDGYAAESARSISARAYTLGSHIVFGSGEYRPDSHEGRRLLAHELAHVLQQRESGGRIQRAKSDEQKPPAAVPAQGATEPEPMEGNKPNEPPTCDQMCGSAAKCQQGKDETCTEAQMTAVGQVWGDIQTDLGTASGELTSPLSPAAAKALKDHFLWNGQTPADVPGKVKGVLDSALTKAQEFLCIRCRDCPKGVSAYVDKGRGGKDCLDYNCYNICPDFFSKKASSKHALMHELLHRVAKGAVQDLYRNQPGYPGAGTTEALKMPDAYASLVDDLVAAQAPAPAPAPGKSPAPPPGKQKP